MITKEVTQEYDSKHDAYKGRWGWHPCDYQTFQKLKLLNRQFVEAQHQVAAWNRWNNKLPHNRVIRKKIRNAEGQVIGRAPFGEPMPEPEFDPLFCRKASFPAYRNVNGKYERYDRDYMELNDFSIVAAYQQARKPQPNPESVRKLSISKDRIDELYRLACL